MSGVYQLPGLFLTVLCHTIVVYYVNEQRYSKRIFALISSLHAVLFVSLMGYGFAAGKWNTFSALSPRMVFSKRVFYL